MNDKAYSVAMTEALHRASMNHLLQTQDQEDLCFATWRPSNGKTRYTAILGELIVPHAGERLLHGNASFFSHYLERAIATAREQKCGLAFLHSHTTPGWQDMSSDDVLAEGRMAPAVKSACQFPLIGLTMGTDGALSARFWVKAAPRRYERSWSSAVRIVGESLRVTFHDELCPAPRQRAELVRTVSAWGDHAQNLLARLRIGVVGAGSVGAMVAEALARMGVGKITLIDFDIVERHNRDRLLHAREEDVQLRRLKISVIGDAIRSSATADPFEIRKVAYSVAEEEGFRQALDCDLLFCCVDRPWGRSVLNLIAYAHLIPVIDGGLSVRTGRHSQMLGADIRAHTVGPGRKCLACLGQYDPSLVSIERDGLLDDPTYISGLPQEHVGRRRENVYALSLTAAALELQQLISLVVSPAGVSNIGPQCYHYATGRIDDADLSICNDACVFPTETALGDHTSIEVTGTHILAQRTREALRL